MCAVRGAAQIRPGDLFVALGLAVLARFAHKAIIALRHKMVRNACQIQIHIPGRDIIGLNIITGLMTIGRIITDRGAVIGVKIGGHLSIGLGRLGMAEEVTTNRPDTNPHRRLRA